MGSGYRVRYAAVRKGISNQAFPGIDSLGRNGRSGLRRLLSQRLEEPDQIPCCDNSDLLSDPFLRKIGTGDVLTQRC
jgi:hypothetical protein